MSYSRHTFMVRMIADVALIAGIFFLPWWLTLSFAVAFFFLFDRFLELLLAGFFLDLLYAVPIPRFGSVEFIFSAVAVFLCIILSLIKWRMRVER